jgi:hypothetical protein
VETIAKLAKKERATEWFVTLKALRLNARETPFLILGSIGAVMVRVASVRSCEPVQQARPGLKTAAMLQ